MAVAEPRRERADNRAISRRILDAALVEFAERGFHGTNIPSVLARAKVNFRPSTEKVRVDFKKLTPETERLAIRYLQTAVRDSVRQNGQLWQPDSRNLFFEKSPVESNNLLGMYRGFGVTIARLPDGGFGLVVDVQFKFIALRPLKARLSEPEFNSRHYTAGSSATSDMTSFVRSRLTSYHTCD